MGVTLLAEGTGWVAGALENITTVFNSATTMIQNNEVAMVFVGISLVGAGIGLFHRLIGH